MENPRSLFSRRLDRHPKRYGWIVMTKTCSKSGTFYLDISNQNYTDTAKTFTDVTKTPGGVVMKIRDGILSFCLIYVVIKQLDKLYYIQICSDLDWCRFYLYTSLDLVGRRGCGDGRFSCPGITWRTPNLCSLDVLIVIRNAVVGL